MDVMVDVVVVAAAAAAFLFVFVVVTRVMTMMIRMLFQESAQGHFTIHGRIAGLGDASGHLAESRYFALGGCPSSANRREASRCQMPSNRARYFRIIKVSSIAASIPSNST